MAEPEAPRTDVAKALQIALELNDLRNIITLEDLRNSHRILKNLKGMPKLKPSEKPKKLSEIAPQLKEEATKEEIPQEETGTQPQRRRFRWLRKKR